MSSPTNGKEYTQLRRALKKQGFIIIATSGKHYQVYKKVTDEKGEEKLKWIDSLPSTSTYPRAFKNTISRLRREGGFIWKGR